MQVMPYAFLSSPVTNILASFRPKTDNAVLSGKMPEVCRTTPSSLFEPPDYINTSHDRLQRSLIRRGCIITTCSIDPKSIQKQWGKPKVQAELEICEVEARNGILCELDGAVVTGADGRGPKELVYQMVGDRRKSAGKLTSSQDRSEMVFMRMCPCESPSSGAGGQLSSTLLGTSTRHSGHHVCWSEVTPFVHSSHARNRIYM